MDPEAVDDGTPAPHRRGTDGYAPGRARRAQIIQAAIELFGEHGYRATSLRQIGAHCGITHAGVLHHFPTKEELLLAVLDARDAEDTAGLQTRVASWGDAIELLMATVHANVTQRRPVVELFTTLAAESTTADHPAHAHFARRYDFARSIMEKGYRMAERQGVLRPGIDPVQAAVQLVAVLDGLQLQWLLSGGELDIEAPLRAFLDSQLTQE